MPPDICRNVEPLLLPVDMKRSRKQTRNPGKNFSGVSWPVACRTKTPAPIVEDTSITEEDIEGINTHAFEQFRVDLNYPRPKEDKRWLALIVLLNKNFLPKDFIWKLYHSERFKQNPQPLVHFAQAVNLVKMAGVAAEMTWNGEMTPLLLKRWVNPKSLVTM